MLVITLLAITQAVFAYTQAEKRQIVLATKEQSLIYAKTAAEIMPDAAYKQLVRTLAFSDWNFVLEAEDTNRICARHPEAAAANTGGKLTFCDVFFKDSVTERRPQSLLHEQVHRLQVMHLLPLERDVECQAIEISVTVLWLAKHYQFDGTTQLAFGHCPGVLPNLRAKQADLSVVYPDSQLLAKGQYLNISNSLDTSDIKTEPETYLSFGDSAKLISDLSQSDNWLITYVGDPPEYKGKSNLAAMNNSPFRDTRIFLKKPGSSLTLELAVTTQGLDIYTNDFEAAFNHKVKITVPE